MVICNFHDQNNLLFYKANNLIKVINFNVNIDQATHKIKTSCYTNFSKLLQLYNEANNLIKVIIKQLIRSKLFCSSNTSQRKVVDHYHINTI